MSTLIKNVNFGFQNLKCSQLWPELKQKENPTPPFPLGRFKSPPSQGGEQEVGQNAGDNKQTETRVEKSVMQAY